MKKKTTMLTAALLFSACLAFSQRSIPVWGTWGNGPVKKQKDIDIYAPYKIKGYNLYILWSDIEPHEKKYNWSSLDSAVKLLIDNDLWIGILVQFGQNCPDWIFKKVPGVITEGGNDPGPYPYYMDTVYKLAYYNILKQIANHINSYDAKTRSFITYWQIAEGSTGDTGPYKGVPVDPQYEISNQDWAAFRYAAWDSVAAYTTGRKYKLLFNGGNDGEYIDYIEEHFPTDMNKDGNLSHNYSFDGELAYFSRQIPHIHDILFNYRSRGEAQGFWNNSWWQQAPLKQSFTMICSAISGGLDMFNIPGGWINQNTSDPRPTDFFNQYGGRRTATSVASGFIALRDVIDFADSARFPPGQYGPVIDPLQLDNYKKAIEQINQSEAGDTYKYWLKTVVMAKYINPSRVNALITEFKSQGAMYNTDGDEYHNDFGVLMTRNYVKFITQLDANETSAGRYRIGADTALYGRYARAFKITNGDGAMSFRLNDDLFNVGGPKFKIQITVTYFDSGNSKWAIVAGKGNEYKVKISNAGTNQWKRITVQFNDFVLRSLQNGKADIALQYIAGDNVAFALIELVNLDKEIKLPESVPVAQRSLLKYLPALSDLESKGIVSRR